MTPEQQAALDATLASVGSKVTYTGASASILSWVLSSEFGILFGIFLGLLGFCVNWFYKHKQDRRENAEHELRMRELEEQQHDNQYHYQPKQSRDRFADSQRSGPREHSPSRRLQR